MRSIATYPDLVQRVGEAHAVRSYQLCQDAVRGIEQLATGNGGGCDWRPKKSVSLASRPTDAPELENAGLGPTKIGIAVDFLSAREMGDRFSFRRPAALLSPSGRRSRCLPADS